jgi:hypothetical protein
MTIIDDLLAKLEVDAPVQEILVGAHWTVVCSRHGGMAATMRDDRPHGHSQVRDAGRLRQKSARELAEYARSDHLMEASIGLAAINSLLDVDESQAEEINALDVLSQHGKGKKVALVGHFPFIPRLRPAVGRLWVIEQHPVEGDYPAEAAVELIPQADIVAITSSALINHTMDDLLSLRASRAEVMALGPSTPLSPVLFSHGITLLSGARVINKDAVLRTVAEGASFQQVEGIRLLTFYQGKIGL